MHTMTLKPHTVPVDFETSKEVRVAKSFDELGLKEDLLKGIYGYNYERPSAIQARAILPITKGRDVIAQAQSGTGKTATFSIGVLERIDTSVREIQALVLAPTRELATQIATVLHALGDYMAVQVHACIGETRGGRGCSQARLWAACHCGHAGTCF